MQRDRIIQIVASAVCVGLIGLSGVLAAQTAASAGRNKLLLSETLEDNSDPEVAIGIAMGAFRGLFVNMLWLRANKLKEEGKYHEAMNLASTITKLQPHFPRVWAFHAWNMAYNISVKTNTADERWNWVNAGIDLLRRDGVPNNPNDLLVHKELAWIFLHKIQGYTDDANPYYKIRLAHEWHEVLGPPPEPDPEDLSRERAVEQYVQWLEPIAASPETLLTLRAQDPAVDGLVTEVLDLVNQARAFPRQPTGDITLDAMIPRIVDLFAAGPRDTNWLKAWIRARTVVNSGRWSLLKRSLSSPEIALFEMTTDEELQPAWTALLSQQRKRVLKDEYNMEPQRMIRYTRKYGPIDWRHGAAHGLYWGAKGVEGALTRVSERNRQDYDFLNTDRVVVHSVQELWRGGNLYFDYVTTVLDPGAANPFYIQIPNVYFIRTYGDILEEVMARGDIFEDESRTFRNYAAGYENFLRDAIRYLYRRGQVAEAEAYKRKAATMSEANEHWSLRPYYWAQSLPEFVESELQDAMTRPSVAAQEVTAALQDAYVSLIQGDGERFRRQFDYARDAHAYFFREQGRGNQANPGKERMESYLDRNFLVTAGAMFDQLIRRLEQDPRIEAYNAAPVELRQWVYDNLESGLREAMDAEAQAGGEGFDAAYPEPPDMEAFRAWRENLIRERQAQSEQERK
ncbi:MAG: hypothetical protein ACF8R7_01190 [Phycisphaerales bacterium JB039]